MTVTFHVEHFEGPLDLLLQLVEKNEVEISTLSLANVAEQFVGYVDANPAIPPEELADFLVVAAKLMYLKSKLLLPSLVDAELEEGPDLETQLREYRRFVEASRFVNDAWNSGRRSFARTARPIRLTGFFLPPGVTAAAMREAMQRVIARLEPLVRLPEASMARVVTIQEKIRDLIHRVRRTAQTSFHSLLKHAKDKTESIVTFLALLELVKQKFVRVAQQDLFRDISIMSHPDAPEDDPTAESYI